MRTPNPFTYPSLRRAALALVALLGPASLVAAADANWPDFRGPTSDGHAAADCKPPLKWSDTDRVRWRTPIPGQGWSSPVVWGDRAWMTTATGNGRSLRAVGVDVNTGKIACDVQVFAVDNPGAKHSLNTFASPSPVVEEGRVYVSFGTHGVACLDSANGDVVWTDPDLQLNFATGAGSSPVLYKDLLILECDAVNAQFVIALDKRTGKQAWRTTRSRDFGTKFPEKRRSFSTAVVQPIGGRDVLLSIGGQRAYGYDPATGKELWFVDSEMGYSCVARPLYHDGLLIFSTGYDASKMFAVKVPQQPAADGKPADLNKSIAWRQKAGVPYKPSLMLAEGNLYMVNDNGVARCLDPKTGEVRWTQRLGQSYSASPVYAGGHIYFLSEKGEVHVLKPNPAAATVVSEFTVEEGFMASPAVVGNALILRSEGHLYRVE